MKRHWETHLYTYATALTQGAAIEAENLLGMREKALAHGHTEGDCLCVERDPSHYIRTGRYARADTSAQECR